MNWINHPFSGKRDSLYHEECREKLPSRSRWHLLSFLKNPDGHDNTHVELANTDVLSLKNPGLHLGQLILSGHLTQFSTVVHSVRIKQGNAWSLSKDKSKWQPVIGLLFVRWSYDFFFLFYFLRRQSYIVYPHPKDGDLAILRTCCDYKYVCFGSARRKPLERYFVIVICLDRVLIVVKEESYAVVFKPEKRNSNLK